jgi:type I restriction enzyme S subunit
MVKNKQNLSPEELLEEALVPEHEWPYKVPENWVWTSGNYIFEEMTSKKPEGEYFFYIDIDAINNRRQIVTEAKKIKVTDAPSRASRGLKNGDTIFSLVRPYLMNIAYIDEELSKCIASTGFYVCRPRGNFNKLFFYRMMTSSYVVDGLNSFMKGDNSPSIKSSDILKFYYPIPPLAEQQRIVNRIESLFEKLDQAKGLIQDALDSFENRKAAILHKAFSGELTRKWREENGVGMESWRAENLGKLLNPMTTVKPEGEIFRYIDIDAIDNRQQIVSLPKIVKTNDAPSRASRGVLVGDVLFSMVRPYLKNIAYITEELTGCIASTGFYVCKCKELLNSRFLYYYLCSKEAIDYLMQFMKGDNSPSIRKGDLEGIILRLPSVQEQEKIVRILESILSKEHIVKQYVDSVEDDINSMKKSILARAFRGELGTNDPEEESAIELLKSILADKINTEQSVTGKVEKIKKERVLTLEEISMSKTIIEVLHEYR